MKTARILVLAGLLTAGIPRAYAVARDAVERIRWQAGPDVGALGHIAEIRIPPGYLFADGADTRVLLERMHNPPSLREVGFLAPANLAWFMVFEYDDIGPVNLHNVHSPDSDAMLEMIRAGNARANKERRRRGWAPLHIMDWEQPPEYARSDGKQEWGIRGQVRGRTVVNWNTRLYGRSGVMRVTLVTSPDTPRDALPEYADILAGFSFREGRPYADFGREDKTAPYGLTALAAGGAAAATVKSGVGPWIWRRIAGALALTATVFRKLLSSSA